MVFLSSLLKLSSGAFLLCCGGGALFLTLGNGLQSQGEAVRQSVQMPALDAREAQPNSTLSAQSAAPQVHQGTRSLLGSRYYLTKRSDFPFKTFHKVETYLRLERETQVSEVPPDQQIWVLPNKLTHPTRNHDQVMLEYEGKQILLSFMGRWNRWISVQDMYTGESWSRQGPSDKDPAGVPMNDLNHVYSVLVDSLDGTKKEIWLNCGFGGDVVNSEQAIKHVRIIDVETLEMRLGPELPYEGGACVAQALEIIRGEPPMICSFGGTHGRHDSGIFQPYTTCYDRVREKFWFPFGRLPYGFDHGSTALVPAGTCKDSDPQRVIVLGYRTRAYGMPHSEVLAFDLPEEGFSLEELEGMSMDKEGPWYLYDSSHWGRHWSHVDEALTPRDAAGLLLANNGRTILHFGGVHHLMTHKQKQKVFSAIRAYDVCDLQWSVKGSLGIQSFALQASASEELQTAFVCGGEAMGWDVYNTSNHPFCLASRFNEEEIRLINRHGSPATTGFPAGFLPGRDYAQL